MPRLIGIREAALTVWIQAFDGTSTRSILRFERTVPYGSSKVPYRTSALQLTIVSPVRRVKTDNAISKYRRFVRLPEPEFIECDFCSDDLHFDVCVVVIVLPKNYLADVLRTMNIACLHAERPTEPAHAIFSLKL